MLIVAVVVTQCTFDVFNPELQGYAVFLSVYFNIKSFLFIVL